MELFNFEDLVAYQRAMDLVEKVYDTMKKFPREEQYALCDQLRRAVVSVPTNIAEGKSRMSHKDQAHFIEIFYGSLMETYCQLNIAKRLRYISEEEFQNLRRDIENVARPLSGLHKSLTSHP